MAPPTGPNDVYRTVYSPTLLTYIYDYYVLGFNMSFIWGCPTDSVLVPFFAENFSRRHLDVGVATGYLPAVVLSRVWRAAARQVLALVDINANSLRASDARVHVAAPATETLCVEADVTAPVPASLTAFSPTDDSSTLARPFDSISMFNLFHCVPGWPDKLRPLRTYKSLLSDHGVLSGCTVLGEAHATGWLSRWYVRHYNRIGIFNNLDDTREGFEKVLRSEFEEVETSVVGMVLLFRAARPRRDEEEDNKGLDQSGYVDLLE